jgi:anti-sigma-K factor RskA
VILIDFFFFFFFFFHHGFKAPPPVSPSNSHLKSTTPRADKRPASHASQEANLAFWRNIAVGAVALAAAVVVVSLVAKKK